MYKSYLPKAFKWLSTLEKFTMKFCAKFIVPKLLKKTL